MNEEEFFGYIPRYVVYNENFGDIEVIIIDDLDNIIIKGDK